MTRLTRFLLLGAAVMFAGAFTVSVEAQAKEPGVVVLKGSPQGGVKFDHAKHAKLVGTKCETCHHASMPAKPMTEKNQRCQDCHTKVAAAPMKTGARAAFHDPMAKKGTCIDCHVKTGAGKAPIKCAECHKKENA